MKPLHLLSPAKLNLFLHITGRRSDGYHELQTLFQLLDFGDEVTISATPGADIQLACPGLNLPPEDNLAWRAAHRLRQYSGCTMGARIAIDKRIPDGGGLGGGSSNAATVLLALNHLWNLGLATEELAAIGLELGADVPVFVHGHSAWAEGVGESIEAVELPIRHYLVIAPGACVSTREVFSHRELTRNTSPITIATFFAGGACNDCEPVVRDLYPEVDKALIWLEKFAPARLTGTGACVFASFEDETRCRMVLEQLPAQWRGFIARGVNTSPVVEALEALYG